MSGYQGLGGYASKAPKHPTDRKPGESDMAYERRMNVIRHHLEPTVSEEEYQALRSQIGRAQTGEGVGIFGVNDGAARGAALGTPYDTGSQRPDKLGGLVSTSVPGSPTVNRVFWSQLDQEQPQVRHLTTGGSSGSGWF